MHLGADIALSTIGKIIAADGHPETMGQDEFAEQLRAGTGPATALRAGTGPAPTLRPAPKLFKENCRIDWQLPAKRVYDFVRGLSPYPGAWTALTTANGQSTTLKILRTTRTQLPPSAPGTISTDRRHIFIATADGQLQIDELQLAGKKRMAAADFLNGTKNLDSFHC